MSRDAIVTRTLADGTVQHECQGPSCWGGRWFVPARKDARFCGPTCRQAAHRERVAREQAIADDLERRRRAAQQVERHHARWTGYLRQHLPANGRASDAVIEQLYRSLIADRMIDGPFQEPTLW